ncbi:hypothetical protein J7T55_009747 [Diaporthe amygdali]|uniref:uncharacterized protein n=1 Tax=Phomopsis amygdali TaxID=1214568 RepID=UPI0022FE7FC9|nr:uncharacterized protein J7T55_009747 [Diaporthe amygdali]KAJ0116597.1 hypothetical protein J7T55_009747 [Diaporthe amygdali]
MMDSSVAIQRSTAEGDKSPEKCFPFLLLPAEMRNKIYRYSLVQSKLSGSICGFVQPPLTRTNKQIRSEALPIYYGENAFYLRIPYPSPNSRQHWADFIRMFRVFSAGGPEGRGSGSLRFVLEKFGDEYYFKDKEGTAWHHWDSVYELVGTMLHEQGRPWSTMEHESVHCFISTIIMVARECPGISKGVIMMAEGDPEPDLGDLGW